jgi:hypothetical protein
LTRPVAEHRKIEADREREKKLAADEAAEREKNLAEKAAKQEQKMK